jgi:hypothetical protein
VLIAVGAWALFLRDSDGGDGEAAGEGPTRVDVKPGLVVSESVGAEAAFPEDQRNLLVKKVRTYVEAATVEPLRTGRPAKGLEALFDAGALAALQGPDGEVMLDQGLPEVTGKLTAVTAPVAINALADGNGAWVMASARIVLDVKGGLDDGTLRIARQGELLFVPEAGDWKITAFDMVVERKGPDVNNSERQTQ